MGRAADATAPARSRGLAPMMSLPGRVAAILVVILAATVGLTTVLAANKYKQGLGEILDARYRLVVSDITATIGTRSLKVLSFISHQLLAKSFPGSTE